MNFIIRILGYLSTTCSFVSALLTTYRTEIAVFANYEIHSGERLIWKEDRLVNFQSKFKNTDLIILDEMGYVPFSTKGAELFFQLISDWYEQKSLVFTSNLEFSQWNRIFSYSRLTAALVDRVIHHAHILNFTGDSFGITHALSRNS